MPGGGTESRINTPFVMDPAQAVTSGCGVFGALVGFGFGRWCWFGCGVGVGVGAVTLVSVTSPASSIRLILTVSAQCRHLRILWFRC